MIASSTPPARSGTPEIDVSLADRNWRRFVLFRVFFNARFYYPVLAIFFLDLGLTAAQYTMLNFAWAMAIVCVDLPAGALADRYGRRPLIVAASVAMVVEMLLLAFAPRNGGATLFLFCLANRLLSGTAEGMASGADEALVFDSLAERGRSAEWPRVLDQVMRWQSVGMVVAVLAGGAVYDPGFMTKVLGAFGVHAVLSQGTTLRFPIYLNLVTAAITLVVALGLKEPVRASAESGSNEERLHPFALVFRAGKWIAETPLALFIIIGGLLIDSVVRLFMTFSSSYLRLIQLPAASFGLIGAALGMLGLAVSPLARRLVRRGTVAGNFALAAAVSLIGFAGLAMQWRWWGVLFVVPLGVTMNALGYFVSYYLNAITDSRHRATVLSFKGLAFNLGYGFVSLLFAGALRALRDGASSPEEVFGRTLVWLPVWLLLTLLVLAIAFARHGKLLGRAVASGE